MLWCHGVQDIGLVNHKLKSALKCTVRLQCMYVPDGQTDGHYTDERYGNSATIRSTNGSLYKPV